MLSLCPESLGPETVVRFNDPSLLAGGVDPRAYIRSVMDAQSITQEIDALVDLSRARMAHGDFTGLGLKPIPMAYGYIYSGEQPLAWLHEHERSRLHMLKLALPSPAEEVSAAKVRIQERVAARRQMRSARHQDAALA